MTSSPSISLSFWWSIFPFLLASHWQSTPWTVRIYAISMLSRTAKRQRTLKAVQPPARARWWAILLTCFSGSRLATTLVELWVLVVKMSQTPVPAFRCIPYIYEIRLKCCSRCWAVQPDALRNMFLVVWIILTNLLQVWKNFCSNANDVETFPSLQYWSRLPYGLVFCSWIS